MRPASDLSVEALYELLGLRLRATDSGEYPCVGDAIWDLGWDHQLREPLQLIRVSSVDPSLVRRGLGAQKNRLVLNSAVLYQFQRVSSDALFFYSNHFHYEINSMNRRALSLREPTRLSGLPHAGSSDDSVSDP